MKIKLILAGFFTLPLIVFGLVNPIIPFIKPDYTKPTVLIVYVIILATSIAVILMAVISMMDYTSKIDNLEKAEKEVYKKGEKLDALIRQYNKLIIEKS